MKQIEINESVVADSRFDRNLAAIPDGPLLQPAVQAALHEYLVATAERLGVVAYAALAVENELAPRAEAEASGAAESNRSVIERLESAVRRNKASWFLVTLLVAVWVLMIAAEWCLNRGVLPWIVGATGFAAAALAGAPSLTPVIFDRVLGALFGTEPWALGIPQPAARKLLLATIGAVNLVAVSMVGECRGVVAVLKAAVSDVTLTAHQTAMVNSALVLLSLALAVDAAVIFLYASHELIEALEKYRIENELRDAQAAQNALDSAASEAKKNAATAVERYGGSNRQISCLKAEFVAERRLLIATRIASIVETKDLQSIVEMKEKTRFFQLTEAA